MLYIIRGLPGSGKSTLARKMLACGMVDKHLEADQLFYDKDGVYNFDPTILNSVHKACFESTRYWLSQAKSVAVSNTFSRKWEMKQYLDLDCTKTVIECHGDYGSVHAPKEVRERMKNRWETL